MNLYAIIRRQGWASPGDLQEAAARSTAIADREIPTDIRWIRSYVLSEDSGDLGTVHLRGVQPREDPRACVARRASVTEIIPIADTVIVDQTQHLQRSSRACLGIEIRL